MPRRALNREQAWLLPPSLDDMMPDGHAAKFIAAVVAELDASTWRELGVDVEPQRLGAPSYPPEALLSIWLYGFMTGVRSCRKLEEACHERIPFIWLAGRYRPDHNTLWRFYQAHRDQMRLLLRRTVKIAVKADLIDLALQAIDGTKVAGNARSERSLGRRGLARLLKRTGEAIADLEAQNATGGDPSPPSLPRELTQAKALRERVREALSELEEEGEASPSASSPAASGSGTGHRQVNLTDPDAVLVKTRHGYVAGYNAQAIVSPLKAEGGEDGGVPPDSGTGGMIITGARVAPGGDDHPELLPMIEQAAANTGSAGAEDVEAAVTIADAGYHSGVNLELAAKAGRQVLTPPANDRKRSNPFDKSHFTYRPDTDTYECPHEQTLSFTGVIRRRGRGRHPVRRYHAAGPACRACPAFGICTNNIRGRTVEAGPHDRLLVRHQALMDSEWAKALYSKRKQLVEPVFGIIKEQQGLRRFLLRGSGNVRSEWTLLATAFNLRTLYRIWKMRLAPNSPVPSHRPAPHPA